MAGSYIQLLLPVRSLPLDLLAWLTGWLLRFCGRSWPEPHVTPPGALAGKASDCLLPED